MNEIYIWVKNIVIYLILNNIIMNLLGNSSYKKYVSIVSGMILVLIVISPFLKLFKLDEILDYYLHSHEFSIEAADYKNDLKHMEEQQTKAIFTEYKERVKKQVSDMLFEDGFYLHEITVTIDKDVNSESFGEIIRMDITAGQVKDRSFNRITIDPVVISDLESSSPVEDKDPVKLPSPAEIQIKNKLSDFYNMEQDNINISIQGG